MNQIRKNLILLKKKLILLGMLANLTTVSLTGCGASNNAYKVRGTNIEIVWENDEIASGTIPYDDILGHIKVVILEQDGTIEPFLMIKEKELRPKNVIYSTILSFINMKNGKIIIQYHWSTYNADIDSVEPTGNEIGKQITILEEHEFYDYLYEYGEIRSEFDVTELIDFYDNEVEPKLLEYIANEYHHTK